MRQPSHADIHPTTSIFLRQTQNNYQRHPVSGHMLRSMNSLIYALIPKIENCIQDQDLETLVQAIVITESNFEEVKNSENSSIAKWTEFLYCVVDFSYHALNSYLSRKSKKMADILEMFWPLFEAKPTQANLIELEKKIINLSILPTISEMDLTAHSGRRLNSTHDEKLLSQFFLRRRHETMQQSLKGLLSNVLSLYNQNNKNYLDTILAMFEVFLSENNTRGFKRALEVYLTLQTSPDEKCHNVQILVNRVLKSQNKMAFLPELASTISLEKVYTADDIYKISMVLLSSIFDSQSTGNDVISVLKMIEKFSYLFTNLKDLQEQKLKALPRTILKYLIKAKVKLLTGIKLKRDMLNKIPSSYDFDCGDQEERIQTIQALRMNMSTESKGDKGQKAQEDPEDERQGGLVMMPYCQVFIDILKSICKDEKVSKLMTFSETESFDFLEDEEIQRNPAICKLILETFPKIISTIKIDIVTKTPLLIRLMVQVAELQSKRSSEKLKQYFQIYHTMLKKEDKMGYHFVVAYIFLNYSSPSQKKEIIDFLIEDTLIDLKDAKNKAPEVLLNLVLLLDCMEISTTSKIKILIRQAFKDYKSLANQFVINDFTALASKEALLINTEDQETNIPESLPTLVSELNKNIELLSSANLALFYSAIIQLNKICKNKDKAFDLPPLIDHILSMQKISTLGLFSLVSKNVEEIVQKDIRKETIIVVYHLLLKMSMVLKDKKENYEFQQLEKSEKMLTQFVQKINTKENIPIKSLISVYNADKKKAVVSDKAFIAFINENQMVRFYSEANSQIEGIYVLASVKCLELIKTLKKLKDKIVINIAEEPEEPKQEEITITKNLRKIELLYARNSLMEENQTKFTAQEIELCRIYVASILLKNEDVCCKEQNENKQMFSQLVQDLEKNSKCLVKICMKDPQIDSLHFFDDSNFVEYVVKEILKNVSEPKNKQQYSHYLTIIKSIVESSPLIKEQTIQSVGSKIAKEIESLITIRTKAGLMITSQEEKLDFLQVSKKVYQLFSQIIKKKEYSPLNLLKALREFDSLDLLEKSKFILEEMQNISSLIGDKQEPITEIIFEHLMALKEGYTENYSKLELPNFICEFFEIDRVQFDEDSLKSLQKHDKSNANICVNQLPSYRCIKCDEKRMICYGCAMSCHKGHPVTYLDGISRGQQKNCFCKELKGNHCIFSDQNINNNSKKEVPEKSPANPVMYYRDLSSSQNRNIFSRDEQMPNRFGLLSAGTYSFGMGDRPRISEYSMGRSRNHREDLEDARIQMLEQFDRQSGYRPGARFGGSGRYESFDRGEIYDRLPMEREFSRIDFLSEDPEQKRDNEEAPEGLQSTNSVPQEEEEPAFEPQIYLSKENSKKMEIEVISEATPLESRSYFLPIFIQMTNEICEKRQVRNISQKIIPGWKLNLQPPILGKFIKDTWRMCNNGSYPIKFRKENPLEGMSSVVIRKTIACRGKYFLIASGTLLFVHLKEKLLSYIAEGKNNPIVFPNIVRQELPFDTHTIDFSPLDDNTFCVAGLHAIAVFTITAQGSISRATSIYHVDKDYVNKVKFTKLGIFFSGSREIKLLSMTCKQIMTIRVVGDPLIKDWTCFEKQSSCVLYTVTPDGHINYGEIENSDQGRKILTSKLNDPRKKRDTGASITVRDTVQAGKMLVASFKDGSNIIGRVQGDQLQDTSFLPLKPLFDKNFILGYMQFTRSNSTKDLQLACTLRTSMTNQMSTHQGHLAIIKIKKDNKVQVQTILPEHKCETFTVIPIGEKSWAVLSLHDDGSLQITLSGKISKATIEDQIKAIKQAQNKKDNTDGEKVEKIRTSLKEKVTLDVVRGTNLNPMNYFREFSSLLRIPQDYSLTKVNDTEYEIKYSTFSKIITGITLPIFGNVKLPTRDVNNVIQIGFSTLEALYYYSQGSFKLSFFKNEDEKYSRDSHLNPRLQDNMHEPGEKFLSSIRSRQMGEAGSIEIECYGESIELYKSRLPKFDQIFNLKEQQKGSEKQLEKVIDILKIFLKNVIETQNFDLCNEDELLEFAENIRKIAVTANAKFYKNLKEIMVSTLQIRARILNINPNPIEDKYHGLRYATESKLEYLYTILKGETGEEETKEFLHFIQDILKENVDLFIFYIAKYPSLLGKVQKKMKKVEDLEIAQALIELYIAGYAVINGLGYNAAWVSPAICSLISQLKSKEIRQCLFDSLRKHANLKIAVWAKTIDATDAEESRLEIELPIENEPQIPNDDFDYAAEMQMYQSQLGEQSEEEYQKMIMRISEIEYEKQRMRQEKAIINVVEEEEKQEEIEEEREMVEVPEPKIESDIIKALIQECMKSLEVGDSAEGSFPKVYVLYVIFKVADELGSEIIDFLLVILKKFLIHITPINELINLSTVMLFMSLFGEGVAQSKYFKQKGADNIESYKEIKTIVIQTLKTLQLEKVHKIRRIPSFMAKMFRGEKVYTDIHVSYGLVSLLRAPCEPDPVLLTLKCYWLFPEKKEYYTRIKYENAMNQSIKTGNIKKLFETAKKKPEIWKESTEDKVKWCEDWIQNMKPDWKLVVDLLSMYYDE